MLLQIRDYICREGIVSTQQLLRGFCLDIQALQPMLDFWVKKGIIGKCQEKTSCQKKCIQCRTNTPEYYYSIS